MANYVPISGGGSKLYLHNIVTGSSPCAVRIQVYTNDETAFTYSTFSKWLYNRNFKGSTGNYGLACEWNNNGHTLLGTVTSANGSLTQISAFVGSNNGTNGAVYYRTTTISIVDGQLSTSTTSSTNNLSGSFHDYVYEV